MAAVAGRISAGRVDLITPIGRASKITPTPPSARWRTRLENQPSIEVSCSVGWQPSESAKAPTWRAPRWPAERFCSCNPLSRPSRRLAATVRVLGGLKPVPVGAARWPRCFLHGAQAMAFQRLLAGVASLGPVPGPFRLAYARLRWPSVAAIGRSCG